MKKFIAPIVTAMALICISLNSCGGGEAPADPIVGTEGLSYSLTSDGTGYICDGIGEADGVKNIIIASRHNGLPVTGIGEMAFYGGEFSSITIPDSVTYIGERAFATCNNIKELAIPSGVTSISESAVCACANLKTVTLGENVTYIGAMAFMQCVSLENINIPDGVSYIGTYAFGNCEKLSSFTFPSSASVISTRTFYYCLGLTSAYIPAGVTQINDMAFIGCENLSAVYYGGDEEDFEEVTVGVNNENMTDNLYYYSETAPEEDDENGYWHYGEEGNIEIW